MGMLLGVLILPANFSDDFGAKSLLKRIPFVCRWALFLFDGAYDKPPLLHWCEQVFGVRVEISRRLSDTGFQVIPKRWIVERTFGWFNWSRRLSKDYEQRPEISEAMIYLSMSRLMLNRLHPR
jgi:putative transposase